MGVYDPKTPSRFNALNIFLFLLLTLGGYFGYWYIPTAFAVFREGGIMKAVCYEAYHQMDSRALLQKLLADSKRTGLRLTEENFKLLRTPWPEELLSGKSSEERGRLAWRGYRFYITLDYTVDLPFPGTDKSRKVSFHRTQWASMENVDWNNAGPFDSCGK